MNVTPGTRVYTTNRQHQRSGHNLPEMHETIVVTDQYMPRRDYLPIIRPENPANAHLVAKRRMIGIAVEEHLPFENKMERYNSFLTKCTDCYTSMAYNRVFHDNMIRICDNLQNMEDDYLQRTRGLTPECLDYIADQKRTLLVRIDLLNELDESIDELLFNQRILTYRVCRKCDQHKFTQAIESGQLLTQWL